MKQPVVIKSRFAPKSYCINIFGTMWSRDINWIDEKVINHERIHTAQMRELLFMPFYIIYVLEWLVRLLQYRDRRKAYFNISFEREAYANGDDLSYLPRRRPFAFFRYLKHHR